MFTALLLKLKDMKQPKCPLTGEQRNKMSMCVHGILFNLKKEAYPDTCYNVHEP